MKLVLFEDSQAPGSDARPGVLFDDRLIDISETAPNMSHLTEGAFRAAYDL